MAEAQATNRTTGPILTPPRILVWNMNGKDDDTEGSGYRWNPRVAKWGANGKLSTFTMDRFLAIQNAGESFPNVEYAMGEALTGQRYTIKVEVDGVYTELFEGVAALEHTTIQSEPDIERYSLTLYGPELDLDGKAVLGAWYPKPSADKKLIEGNLPIADRTMYTVMQTYLPAIFNPGGKPNATPSGGGEQRWRLTNAGGVTENGCACFAAPDRTVYDENNVAKFIAEPWTAYLAIRSVIEWFDGYSIIDPTSTNWPAVEKLLVDDKDQPIELRNVNITGMSLLEAMRAILLPIGFGFAIEPWETPGVYKHRLIIYSLHKPSVKRYPPMVPIFNPRKTTASAEGRRAEVTRLEMGRDSHNVANYVYVVGDHVYKTVTFSNYTSSNQKGELRPAWDYTSSDHDLADYLNANTGTVGGGWNNWKDYAARTAFDVKYGNYPNIPTTEHVFRTFVWNEDGRWNSVKVPMGDLTGYGWADPVSSDDYVRRPRPFLPRFTDFDPGKGSHEGPLIEIQIANDSQSRIPLSGAQVLRMCNGFTVTEKDLTNYRPYGSTKNKDLMKYKGISWLTMLKQTFAGTGDHQIKLYVTGSVSLDEVVVGVAPRRADSAWPRDVQRVVYAPDRYKARRVADGTGAAGDPLSNNNGVDTCDDTDVAMARAFCVRDYLEDAVGNGSLILRGILRTYSPGDGIPNTADRAIRLTIDSTSGSKPSVCPIVAGVGWNFAEGAYRTELLLDTTQMKVIQ